MIDERTKQAFQRASTNGDFVEWLNTERAKQLGNLVAQTEPALIYRTQGRVKALEDLLQLLAASRKA